MSTILSIEQFQALARQRAERFPLEKRSSLTASLKHATISPCPQFKDWRENWYMATKLSPKHSFGQLAIFTAWKEENFPDSQLTLGELTVPLTKIHDDDTCQLNQLFNRDFNPRLFLIAPRLVLVPGLPACETCKLKLPHQILELWPSLYAAYLAMAAGLEHDSKKSHQLLNQAQAIAPTLNFVQEILLWRIRLDGDRKKAIALGCKLCELDASPQALHLMYDLTHINLYRPDNY